MSPLLPNFVETIAGTAPLLKASGAVGFVLACTQQCQFTLACHAAGCCCLQMLCIDSCDMTTGGFELEAGRHAALTTIHVSGVVKRWRWCLCVAHSGQLCSHSLRCCHSSWVQVCRCREVDGCGLHTAHGAGDRANPPISRRIDAGLVVHMLQHGRSVHLPAG